MKKSLFRTTISLLLVLLLSTPSFATEAHIKDEKSISTAHVFPVRPGTDAWKSLTPTERRASTFISAEKVSKMTTPALLETVLNYPYLCDLYAFDTLKLAYKVVSESFPALAEFVDRPDASQVIALFYDSEINSSTIDYYRLDDIIILNQLLLLETGLKADIPLFTLSLQSDPNPNVDLSRFSVASVLAPNGESVEVYVDMTWSDHYFVFGNHFTNGSVSRKIEEYLETYPSTTVVDTYSSKYNCHSYAWYSTSTSNRYWMLDPSEYLEEGSYSESTYESGARVTYTTGGSIIHSAIVVNDASSVGNVVVRSKWGVAAVFQHDILDCPYSGTVDFWELE